MMHGWRVGVAVSHFQQLLVEVPPIQFLLLAKSAGRVSLVWKAYWCGLRPESRCGRAQRPSRIIGAYSTNPFWSEEMAFLSV